MLHRVICGFYDHEWLGWAEMGSAQDLVHEHNENALAFAHFLLAGDFFEKHEEYEKIMDLMKDPKVLKKYKQLIIQPGADLTGSCGVPEEIVHPKREPFDFASVASRRNDS